MSTHAFITRGIAVLAAAASLVAVSIPALSQSDNGRGPVPDAATRQARLQEHVQSRLARMAQRLAINPSQQGAWSEYATTAQSLLQGRPAKPAADADAVALIRFRAELAANHARQLTQLAEATAKLTAVLSPEQRQTLNQMTRERGFAHKRQHQPHSG